MPDLLDFMFSGLEVKVKPAAMREMFTSEFRRTMREWAPDARRGAGRLLGVVLVSAVIPWLAGLHLLDPLVFIPVACLSVFPTARSAARLFAGPAAQAQSARPPAREAVPAAAGAAALTGSLESWALAAGGLLWLNYWNWHGAWLLPSWGTLASAALASLAASSVIAVWSILVATDSADLDAARRAMRLRLVVVSVVVMFGPQYIPAAWTRWVAEDLTTGGVARKTAAVSLVLFASAWLLAKVAVRRVTQWSAMPPSLNTYSGRDTGL